MPVQSLTGGLALVVGALLLLQLFLIGRVHSNPDHAASLLQYEGFVDHGPLYVEVVMVELPSAAPDEHYDRGAVQLDIEDMGHRLSSELGRFQDLQMARCCMGLEQWKGGASTQDIKMGRSYRKFLEGRFLEEEQLLWFKCQPSGFDVNDDDDAGESKYMNIATLEMFRADTPSRGMQAAGILQAFLITHPSFFLHLALAFLLIAFLASLVYFSLD